MRAIIVASCLCLMMGYLAACSAPPPEEGAPVSLPTVNTLQLVAATGYHSRSTYTGRVEAVLRSNLAFEIPGLVVAMPAAEGDQVVQGDVLSVLDTGRLDAQLARAKAEVARIQAQLKLANVTFERTRDAFRYQGVSQQQLDESEQQVSVAQASLQVARANVQSIAVDLAKSTLKAAFDGVITQRYLDPGAVVAAGAPLMELQSLDRLEARIGLSPAAANTLNDTTRYHLSINGQAVPATLRSVLHVRNERSRTVDAIFTLSAEGAPVRPGDSASFEAQTWNEIDGFWLPLAALVEGARGLWQVLIADSLNAESHRLQTHTVELLYADDQRAFVRGTIEAGDLLVSEGTQRVVAGQTVRVRREENAEIAGGELYDH